MVTTAHVASDVYASGRDPSYRKMLLRRWNALKNERYSWDQHWSDISRYLLPRNGRFYVEDTNRGGKKHNAIIDNTATRSLRTLASGLMAGATSPARPWFALTSPDPELNDHHTVKLWLEDTARRMHRVFQLSNTYRALHQMYEELAAFGTAASIIVPDFDNVIHHHVLTVGQYALAQDYRGNTDTLFREFQMTVAQLVEEFGLPRCSESVKRMFANYEFDTLITVVHAIEPRRGKERDPSKRDNKNMPWKSCYFEVGQHEDKLLRETGFERFPCVAPRWSVAGGDVYGMSPAMDALGDIKQLQQEQHRKANGIDYMTKPPVIADQSFKGMDERLLPGSVTFGNSVGPNTGIRSAFDVRIDLNHLLTDIQDVRGRINAAFYADLFLMLAQAGPDTRMTATEVAERHEEKLLMLGPVLERLHNELLKPLIDITFERMFDVGALQPPPPELEGMDLGVEFESVLAQAQRAIGTNNIDRFVGALGVVAQMKETVLDRFNEDEWVDRYAHKLGVDSEIIVPIAEAKKLRTERNKMQAEQAKLQAQAVAASTAKDAATAQATAPVPSSDPLDAVSGYTTPQNIP